MKIKKILKTRKQQEKEVEFFDIAIFIDQNIQTKRYYFYDLVSYNNMAIR